MRGTRQVELAAQLAAELHDDAGLRYLGVRSVLDPGQSFLLPLPTPPAIDGLALQTGLGRLHALPWALAWGTGIPPAGCEVAFATDSLRFRRAVHVEPQVLGDACWVAAAEGLFTTATTVVAGVETARVPLANRY